MLSAAAIIGIAAGYLIHGDRALLIGAAIPWLTLLAYLLIAEAVVPYRGGGASMWPIAQLWGGTFVAIAGLLGAAITQEIRRRRHRSALPPN